MSAIDNYYCFYPRTLVLIDGHPCRLYFHVHAGKLTIIYQCTHGFYSLFKRLGALSTFFGKRFWMTGLSY